MQQYKICLKSVTIVREFAEQVGTDNIRVLEYKWNATTDAKQSITAKAFYTSLSFQASKRRAKLKLKTETLKTDLVTVPNGGLTGKKKVTDKNFGKVVDMKELTTLLKLERPGIKFKWEKEFVSVIRQLVKINEYWDIVRDEVGNTIAPEQLIAVVMVQARMLWAVFTAFRVLYEHGDVVTQQEVTTSMQDVDLILKTLFQILNRVRRQGDSEFVFLFKYIAKKISSVTKLVLWKLPKTVFTNVISTMWRNRYHYLLFTTVRFCLYNFLGPFIIATKSNFEVTTSIATSVCFLFTEALKNTSSLLVISYVLLQLVMSIPALKSMVRTAIIAFLASQNNTFIEDYIKRAENQSDSSTTKDIVLSIFEEPITQLFDGNKEMAVPICMLLAAILSIPGLAIFTGLSAVAVPIASFTKASCWGLAKMQNMIQTLGQSFDVLNIGSMFNLDSRGEPLSNILVSLMEALIVNVSNMEQWLHAFSDIISSKAIAASESELNDTNVAQAKSAFIKAKVNFEKETISLANSLIKSNDDKVKTFVEASNFLQVECKGEINKCLSTSWLRGSQQTVFNKARKQYDEASEKYNKVFTYQSKIDSIKSTLDKIKQYSKSPYFWIAGLLVITSFGLFLYLYRRSLSDVDFLRARIMTLEGVSVPKDLSKALSLGSSEIQEMDSLLTLLTSCVDPKDGNLADCDKIKKRLENHPSIVGAKS